MGCNTCGGGGVKSINADGPLPEGTERVESLIDGQIIGRLSRTGYGVARKGEAFVMESRDVQLAVDAGEVKRAPITL